MRDKRYEALLSRGAPTLRLRESWDADWGVPAGVKRRQHTHTGHVAELLHEGRGGVRSDLII